MLAQHDRGDDARSDEGHRRGDPDAVGAERCDEDEQHAARHERLGAGERAEGERVGEQHGRGDAERREHVPAGEKRDRSDGGAELLADEVQFEPEQLPGLRRRQQQAVGVAVEHGADQPDQAEAGDRERDPHRDPQQAQGQSDGRGRRWRPGAGCRRSPSR